MTTETNAATVTFTLPLVDMAAAASWVPREGQARVIHLPEPRTTSSAWANREESTWIDKM